ncbi:AraC family transcriptional regulator [Streptococcus didelphis]|uniref:AraC family transcriptional regulator n=1 Tax=Streptococcus didelphis TaxID=102886 RepID=UPI0003704C31|nr:AraC family transcriptional regulator [Streptococcus didelphis]WMB28982.1 AraC family transcriptional regulator [Streptococcus didelphis]
MFISKIKTKNIEETKKQLLTYSYFHHEVKDGRPDVLFHWHPEIEISYVSEGTAKYHIDYDFFNSQAGDIILVRPNGMHSIHPINDNKHVTDTFKFHLDMLGSSYTDQVSLHYLQPLQNSNFKFLPCIKPDMPGYSDIKACLFAIFQLAKEKGRHFEILLKSKLHELIYLLYYHRYVLKKHTDETYRKNEKIRQLVHYINTNFNKPLSIESLADYIGYSKTHFMTVFKQHTGTSCTEFVIQVRLSKACELLLNSTSSILEIAKDTGFNNLSNFNRQFKRYYLLTPSQYRKKHSKATLNPRLTNIAKL